MTRRDITLTIALCASLSLHVLLLASAAEIYARSASQIWLAGFQDLPGEQPTPQVILVPVPQDPWRRLGDSSGQGQAILPSSGEQPMQAPQGLQEQSFSSLDPIGAGKIGDEPTETLVPAAEPQPPVEEAQPPVPPVPAMFGFGNSPERWTVPQLSKPPAPTPAVSAGSAQAADPAPKGASESDPTSVEAFADFRPGSTEVRIGRKFKLIRPRLDLAGRADLYSIRAPVVVLRLRIDQTGKVTSAEIFRSSGSRDIDQPCQLAAYNWWFEPLKDETGQPIKDVFLFTVRFL